MNKGMVKKVSVGFARLWARLSAAAGITSGAAAGLGAALSSASAYADPVAPAAAAATPAAAVVTPTATATVNSGWFTPVPNDLSVLDFLIPIFGMPFGGANSAPLESALGVINAGALILGGILAAYVMVVGTMQTAHDGEMMGKAWSSMWVPIRTSVGVALVVPINGGYCVAQLLIAWLTLQGIGFADSLWNTFVDSYFSPSGMAPRVPQPATSKLVSNIGMNLFCMQVINYTRSEPNSGVIFGSDIGAMSIQSEGNKRFYGYGNDTYKDACGSVQFTKWNEIVTGVNSDDLVGHSAFGVGSPDGTSVGNGILGSVLPFGLGGNSMGALAGLFNNETIQAISGAHMNAVVEVENELTPWAENLAAKIFAGGADLSASDMAALRNASLLYSQRIADSTAGLLGSSELFAGFQDGAKQDGWVMAGAWFMKASALQDQVSRVVSNVPDSNPPDLEGKGLAALLRDGKSNAFATYEGLVQKLSKNGTLGIDQDESYSVGTNSNLWQKFSATIMKKIISRVTPDAGDSNRNSMMAVKDYGDALMWAGEAGMVGSIAVMAGGAAMKEAGSSVSKVPVIGGLLGAIPAGLGAAVGTSSMIIGSMLLTISASLVVFGASIAIYLPLAPFLIFFGTFLGWLVLVMEAMIAAPLWSIMHLSPAGNDFMGGAKQGYMLIVSLMLRPALVVCGFVGALLVIDPIIVFFHKIYFSVFVSSMAGSFMGLVSMLVMIVLYFGFMVHLFHKGFGLIHYVPDKILKWIGGGGEMLGTYGEAAHQQGHAVVAGMLGNTVRSTGSNAAMQAGQKEITKQNERNARLQNSSSISGAVNGGNAKMESLKGKTALGMNPEAPNADKAEQALDGAFENTQQMEDLGLKSMMSAAQHSPEVSDHLKQLGGGDAQAGAMAIGAMDKESRQAEFGKMAEFGSDADQKDLSSAARAFDNRDSGRSLLSQQANLASGVHQKAVQEKAESKSVLDAAAAGRGTFAGEQAYQTALQNYESASRKEAEWGAISQSASNRVATEAANFGGSGSAAPNRSEAGGNSAVGNSFVGALSQATMAEPKYQAAERAISEYKSAPEGERAAMRPMVESKVSEATSALESAKSGLESLPTEGRSPVMSQAIERSMSKLDERINGLRDSLE